LLYIAKRSVLEILRCHFSGTKIAQLAPGDDKDRERERERGEKKCKRERRLYSDGLLRSDEPINGARAAGQVTIFPRGQGSSANGRRIREERKKKGGNKDRKSDDPPSCHVSRIVRTIEKAKKRQIKIRSPEY